jgi:twitching motility two-component system response regulator PilH
MGLMPSKTILLVDDSPTEMRIMHTALEGRGYRLVTAVDGEEALQKVLAVHPDLILLDIILPKKNGFQVCRQIKTAPETKDTKIIMVSSKSQDTDKYWGLRQGADEYLTKPFTAQELLTCVSRYL